ncbi:HD-GYP domain-containing protein [Rhizosaccharibacter radicis]|uniref:HD-GYP domain-containing protein n=1 Tax=Rhizosaccharibacter radicis TaxID=2782605 RepID=A0ABT1W3D7_9PROT|nr:hypothetical protein [Acetobacteraceae bacterium KSS12]
MLNTLFAEAPTSLSGSLDTLLPSVLAPVPVAALLRPRWTRFSAAMRASLSAFPIVRWLIVLVPVILTAACDGGMVLLGFPLLLWRANWLARRLFRPGQPSRLPLLAAWLLFAVGWVAWFGVATDPGLEMGPETGGGSVSRESLLLVGTVLALPVLQGLARRHDRRSDGVAAGAGSMSPAAGCLFAERLLMLGQSGARARRDLGPVVARIALAAGLGRDQAEDLAAVTPLRDVGYLGLPSAGSESPAAVDIQHTRLGFRMLHGTGVPLLELAAELSQGHHERWDGNGFPRNLRGDSIPLSCRVLAIAESAARCIDCDDHRSRMTGDVCLAGRIERHLRLEAGRSLDPVLVEHVLFDLPAILGNELLALSARMSRIDGIAAGDRAHTPSGTAHGKADDAAASDKAVAVLMRDRLRVRIALSAPAPMAPRAAGARVPALVWRSGVAAVLGVPRLLRF